MKDAELAAFATPGWVANVAAVPPEEMATMVAEDPSIVTALIGALRHARLERDAARAEVRERDKKLAAIAPIISVVDDWDWNGLACDAQREEFGSAEEVFRAMEKAESEYDRALSAGKAAP